MTPPTNSGIGTVPKGTAAPLAPNGNGVKAAYKAPPGYVLVKQPNGKYKLVKKKTTAAAKPKPGTGGGRGGAAPAPVDPVSQFVGDEIQRQIGQDLALTNYTDQQTADISKLMSEQAANAARIAGEYNPVSVFQNATLDANAQNRIAGDLGLTNAVGNDQARSLASLIAKSGSAGTDLLGAMRASGQIQHRDYSRQLEGLRPGLEQQRRDQLLAQKQAAEAHAMTIATQRMQNRLAQEQFGLQKSQAADASALNWAGVANAGAGGSGSDTKPAEPANKGIYGFGKERDDVLGGIIAAWMGGQQPTVDKQGDTIPAVVKQPWRELHQSLIRLGGLNADQAALLATKSSPDSIRNANKGAKGVIAMLRARGVSDRVQAFIIKQYFGAETWANLSTNGAQRPANATSGTYQPGASGTPPKMPTTTPKAGYMWSWQNNKWIQIKKPTYGSPLK
jgi:hypothetical protein